MSFDRRRFTKMVLSSAAAYPLLAVRPRAARAENNLLDTFIPADLRPLVDFVKGAVGAYQSVSGALQVTEKVLEMLGILQTPPSVTEMLAAIQHQIAQTAAETLWTIKGLDRQNRLGIALGKTQTAMQQRLWGMPVDGATLGDSNATVKQALMPMQWERVFNPVVTGGWGDRNYPNRWLWKDLFNDAGVAVDPPIRTEYENGVPIQIVSDWRLGVPQLLQLLALRVQVIAAADPEFRERRSVFTGELLEYKQALERQIDSMRAGVRSASLVQFISIDGHATDLWVGAADVHTGASYVQWFNLDLYPGINLPVARENLEAYYRNMVLDSMPIAGMQEVANSLEALANP